MTGQRAIYAIGLNVNGAEPADQLNRTLACVHSAVLSGRAGPITGISAPTASEWEGVRERCVQVAHGPRHHCDPAIQQAARYARQLRQTSVAVLVDNADRWLLAYADGRVEAGGSIEEYPLLPGVVDDYRVAAA
jgi:hypothetical protein